MRAKIGKGLLSTGLLSAAALLSGCANKPLPEDYSSSRTTDIVHKIQCEAQGVLMDQLIKLLTREEASAQSQSIGRGLASGSTMVSQALRSKLDPETEGYVERYDTGAIAFEFSLNMKETNKGDAGIDLLRPLTGGSLSFGVGATTQFDRANLRKFTVSYDFEELLSKFDRTTCEKLETGRNIAYPITGTIGLDELLETFFKLNNLKTLALSDKKVALVDTLKFTTTLTLGAEAGLSLKAAGQRWQTTGASGLVSNTRTDEHQVTISLSLPPDPEPKDKTKGTAAKQGAGSKKAARENARQSAIRGLKEQQVFRLNKTLEELGVR